MILHQSATKYLPILILVQQRTYAAYAPTCTTAVRTQGVTQVGAGESDFSSLLSPPCGDPGHLRQNFLTTPLVLGETRLHVLAFNGTFLLAAFKNVSLGNPLLQCQRSRPTFVQTWRDGQVSQRGWLAFLRGRQTFAQVWLRDTLAREKWTVRAEAGKETHSCGSPYLHPLVSSFRHQG